jgi:hypothetical protein
MIGQTVEFSKKWIANFFNSTSFSKNQRLFVDDLEKVVDFKPEQALYAKIGGKSLYLNGMHYNRA